MTRDHAAQGTPRLPADNLLAAIEERLVTPRPDCRLWVAAMDRGYGRISVEGRTRRVHRVVYELLVGPIPEGLTIDHLCRVRNCVNVDHMELVTGGENARRAVEYRPRYITGPRAARSHCKRGHEYTPENTRRDVDGFRICRACVQITTRARAERESA